MRAIVKRLTFHINTSALYTGVLLYHFLNGITLADDRQLFSIKDEIFHQTQELNISNKKLSRFQINLKKQKQLISVLATKVHTVSFMLRALTNEIATLNEASQHLKQLKLGQIELLKELLNSQYHQGKNNQINTFLNGKDSYNLDRMVVYAEHLSKARTDATNILVTTNTTLQLKRHILDQQKQKQTVLLNTLKTNITTLEKRQNAQHKMINAVQRKIRSNKNYLSELRSNADRLKVELDKAAEQANIKMNGLGEYKGKLHWPVKGKVLHSFGSAQTGELHWNGMVVAAEKGTTVNATHDGIVVLSNWLRGYGLMLVIDHGKGDMSFYGYNQALLKNIGETVKAGDPIALIGNSGGQTNMGLYFEIRRQGNATNPSLWLVQ